MALDGCALLLVGRGKKGPSTAIVARGQGIEKAHQSRWQKMNLISGTERRGAAHLEASARPTDWRLMAVCLLQYNQIVTGLNQDSQRVSALELDPLTLNLFLSVSIQSGGNSIGLQEDCKMAARMIPPALLQKSLAY